MTKRELRDGQHGAAWDDLEFLRQLSKLGCVSPPQADGLRFHLSELLGCCANFQAKVDSLMQAFGTAQEDSTPLWEASSEMLGELEHIKYHVRGALGPMRRIQGAAREMYPIGDMSDEALSEQTLADTYSSLERAGIDIRKPQEETKDQSTGKSSKKEHES